MVISRVRVHRVASEGAVVAHADALRAVTDADPDFLNEYALQKVLNGNVVVMFSRSAL